jgi:Flp pilus assembly protein TadD
LQIDPRLPEAEIALAKHALFSNLDWSSAEQRLLRAIELEPALSSGHFAYGILLAQLGRFESSLLEFRCARELDPLSLPINTGVAWSYYYAAKLDQAAEECQKALNLGPRYFEALACMGLIRMAQGQPEEALPWLERAVSESQGALFAKGFLAYCHGINGRAAEARAILAQLDAAAEKRYVTPVAGALVHLGLGELDEALTSLEKALAQREAFLAYLKVFPPFRPLHSSPRFRSLLNEIANASTSQLLTI